MENDKKIKINGKKLKDIRINKGITQEDVAKAIGISKPMISYYENNTSKLDEEKVMKLCVLFNCTIRDITGIEEKKETINKNIKQEENIKIEETIKDLIELNDNSKKIIQELIKLLKSMEQNKPKTNQIGDIQNSSSVNIVQQ